MIEIKGINKVLIFLRGQESQDQLDFKKVLEFIDLFFL
jgi:hypothetical protein